MHLKMSFAILSRGDALTSLIKEATGAWERLGSDTTIHPYVNPISKVIYIDFD